MPAMCPSFQATREEEHSTRGRANLLRAALSGQLPLPTAPTGLCAAAEPAWADVYEALDLCLSCKACKADVAWMVVLMDGFPFLDFLTYRQSAVILEAAPPPPSRMPGYLRHEHPPPSPAPGRAGAPYRIQLHTDG